MISINIINKLFNDIEKSLLLASLVIYIKLTINPPIIKICYIKII